MPTFVDEAVVLRRIDFADADRILTVLTREHGKLGVIAKGVRKPRARMAAHTDLFVRSSMQLAQGRGELFTLTQAQRVDVPTPMADPLRAACAALIAELADSVLEAHHPDAATYDLIAGALSDTLDNQRDPRGVVVWCTRRLIDRLGYAPRVDDCVGCERPLPEAPAWFSASGGGMLCASCAVNDPSAVECSVRVIKVLRCIQARNLDLYVRLRLDDATLTTFESILERELAQHLGRGLRSFDVMRALK